MIELNTKPPRTPRKQRQVRPMKYQVNHSRTSGGPSFSSITEACHYIAHCMKEGEPCMIISRLTPE